MKISQNNEAALVVFGKDFSITHIAKQKFDTIVTDKIFQKKVESLGCHFVELDTLIDTGNIKEASMFLEELSLFSLSDGTRISKSFTYEGYELWWAHYGSLFLYFCLPYMQYRKLFIYLKNFQNISFYQPPYKSLFYYYFRAYGSEVDFFHDARFKSPAFLPFGVFFQLLITLLSIPILIARKCHTVLFTGDKFEKSKDYDFRMRFIYEELRQRNIPFVEFIRSLESWKNIFNNAIKRKRPVIYSEAVSFVGRFASIISGGRRNARQRFRIQSFSQAINPEDHFKFLVATHYLINIYDDIWAIRIMKFILRIIGIRAAFIPAMTERNFHTVLGCKLNAIPTVGILHGVASSYSTPYDFMAGFDGDKMLSVDMYGLWSEWWKEYYIKNSKAYKSKQLYISGPMRSLKVSKKSNISTEPQKKLIRVLFIAEQNVAPSEVMPYLRELIDMRDIKLIIKFRPYRDGFEDWLLVNEPQIFKQQHLQIVKGEMQKAIQNTDVVVGCRSTGVLEALLQLKVPIFLHTQKWGDYYNMIESNKSSSFFAGNPVELIERIKNARAISVESIIGLREQYFGDPYKNGSKWVVDRIEELLIKK